MRRLWMAALVVGGLGASALAAEPGSEQTCGQVLKEDAKYNEQLADMATAIANNYEEHAKWVGTGTKAAKAEYDALNRLARLNRELASEARKLGDAMRANEKLAAAPHKMDAIPTRLTDAMDKAVKSMRDYSTALSMRADEWERMMRSMTGVGGAGMEMEQESPKPVEPTPTPSVPEAPMEQP